MNHLQPDSAETTRLLADIEQGDDAARGQLLERYTSSIRRSVARRLNPKLQPRVDLSDVVQETQIDLIHRLDEYLKRTPMPFRLWVLKTAHQRLQKIERFHLQTAKRSVERELPLPDQSSMDLAHAFISQGTKPETMAAKRETAQQVRRALGRLRDNDREIITLRNFEGLSNVEAAQVLEVTSETAKKRYSRAVIRLEQLLHDAGLTGGDA